MRFARSAVLGAVLSAGLCAHAADSWQISFFYDKPEQNFDIADMQCPAAGHCLAVGAIEQGDKFNPWGVITADGGAHWTPVKIPELPTSLFFRSADLGWMVTTKAVWQSRDGGLSWKKLRGVKDVQRVFFLDDVHGFAACDAGKLLETRDGGASWTDVRGVEAEMARHNAPVVLEWVSFRDARNGMVVGEITPAGANRVPAWLEPAQGRSQRTPNDVVVIGRTADGGASWTWSTIPRNDDLVDAVFRPDTVWLVFQPSAVASPSEIARTGWSAIETAVVLHDNNALLADAAQAGDTIYVAAIPRQGRVLNLPVPGKLRMFSGPDFERLERDGIDYRAIARRVTFAVTPAGEIFLGTDTGMILRPVKKP